MPASFIMMVLSWPVSRLQVLASTIISKDTGRLLKSVAALFAVLTTSITFSFNAERNLGVDLD